MAILNNRYPLLNKSPNFFRFMSTGPKGEFILVGGFEEVVEPQKRRLLQTRNYNLAFGLQMRLPDGTISADDEARIDNDDMDKIFNTIAFEVNSFMGRRRNCVVSFKGSTVSRTRKYRMMLSKYYEVISDQYTIFGVLNGTFVEFEPNTNLKYESFLVEHKK
jgi:hypothetical protein